MSVTSLTRKLSFWQTPAAPSASLATAGCRARSQGAQCLPPACAGYSRPVPGFSRPLHASPKSAFESSPFHPPSSALDCFTLIPLISELDFPSAFIPVALRTGGAPKTPFPLSNPALSTVFTRSFLPSCAPNPLPFLSASARGPGCHGNNESFAIGSCPSPWIHGERWPTKHGEATAQIVQPASLINEGETAVHAQSVHLRSIPTPTVPTCPRPLFAPRLPKGAGWEPSRVRPLVGWRRRHWILRLDTVDP